MIRAASFSRDRRYRYRLGRRWGDGPLVAWVMLNPSTADATVDDPTIRRCIAFSRDWGFGALVAVNLFALRSPDPRALLREPDPVGPRAQRPLRAALREADLVVAGWGNAPLAHPALLDRALQVRWMLPAGAVCLGLTGPGQPRHPLYVPADQAPVPLGPPAGPSPMRPALIVGGRRPTMAA